MSSNPTASNGFEKQGQGENLNDWGRRLNVALDMIDARTDGVASTVVTTDWGLTITNYIVSDGLKNVQRMTGAPAADFTVTLPSRYLSRWFHNLTGKTATITNGAGASATVRNGMLVMVYSDPATGCFISDPRLNELRAANASVDFGNQKAVNVADGVANSDGANVGQVIGLVAPYATAAAGSAAAAATSAGAAATSASNAATSEANAAASAAKLTGTSTSSVAIGTGSKTFATQTGKFFDPGARVIVTSDANPANRSMFGVVTAYSAGSLTINVTATTGSGTFTDWTIRVSGERGAQGASGSSLLYRSARTSNAKLLAADVATLIDITSGTFTQTFDPAANLGNGWWVRIRNAGTGDITLDPNGSETIDGMTSFIMYPGEIRDVQCDGFGFYSTVLKGFRKDFTSSATFVKPPGYLGFAGIGWGSGGGGGNFASGSSSGGGGAAGQEFSVDASLLAASETITIAAASPAETAGSNSTFGSLLTFYGGGRAVSFTGGGGSGVLGSATGATGGSPRTGTTDQSDGGGDGSSGGGKNAVHGGGGGGQGASNGGSSIFGGGGGGGTDNSTAGTGGASKVGGRGGNATVSGTGQNGTAPGGGGGGGNAGGQGARGEIRVRGVF